VGENGEGIKKGNERERIKVVGGGNKRREGGVRRGGGGV
jgi:hypothetical protein